MPDPRRRPYATDLSDAEWPRWSRCSRNPRGSIDLSNGSAGRRPTAGARLHVLKAAKAPLIDHLFGRGPQFGRDPAHPFQQEIVELDGDPAHPDLPPYAVSARHAGGCGVRQAPSKTRKCRWAVASIAESLPQHVLRLGWAGLAFEQLDRLVDHGQRQPQLTNDGVAQVLRHLGEETTQLGPEHIDLVPAQVSRTWGWE